MCNKLEKQNGRKILVRAASAWFYVKFYIIIVENSLMPTEEKGISVRFAFILCPRRSSQEKVQSRGQKKDN